MAQDAVVHDLGGQIRRLVQTTQRLRVEVAARMGIGVTELVALGHLTQAVELTPKDLAARLQLSTGTVTAVTDRLVDAGFARRAPNPADRRSILLRATPAGTRARERADQEFEELVGTAVSGSPAAVLVDVTRALDAVAGRIEADLRATSTAC